MDHFKSLFMKMTIVFLLFTLSVANNQHCYSQDHSLHQITFSDSTHDGYPYWSPDSKHIAFTSSGLICILNIVSGECTEVFHLEGKIAVPFDWTPDGEYILADIRDTINRGETDIWLVPIDKGQARQLTFFTDRILGYLGYGARYGIHQKKIENKLIWYENIKTFNRTYINMLNLPGTK